MQVLRKTLLAICFAVLIPAGAMAGPLEDQVNAAYTAWNEAFNKGDAKAISAFYTDDSVFLPGSHDIIKGPAGVEKFFAGFVASGGNSHSLELIEAHEDGGMVVAAAKWSAKAKDQAVGGVATHVFKKQGDGSMKLMLHTFN